MDKPNDNAFIKRVQIKKDYMVFDNDKIDILEKHAESLGETLKDFINRAVKETMERDNCKEERIYFTLDKDKKDILKDHLEDFEETLDDFMNRIIDEAIKRDKEELEDAVKGLEKEIEKWDKEMPETPHLNQKKINMDLLLGKHRPLHTLNLTAIRKIFSANQ